MISYYTLGLESTPLKPETCTACTPVSFAFGRCGCHYHLHVSDHDPECYYSLQGNSSSYALDF